jgi:hypothetical protein
VSGLRPKRTLRQILGYQKAAINAALFWLVWNTAENQSDNSAFLKTLLGIYHLAFATNY